jgi:hypothetical protein
MVWQQPLGQLDALHSHAPFTHSVPGSQARQVTPPVPQAFFVLPATHPCLASQQPGQVAVVQTPHTPLTHATPAAHSVWQPPQCLAFVLMLRHSPPQQRSSSSHWMPQPPQCFSLFSRLTHLPPQQVLSSPHRSPQLPQFLLSFWRLTHLPPQQRSSSSHRIPHPPQWFLFVFLSTHTPLHRCFCGSGHGLALLSLLRLSPVAPATPGKEAIKEPARAPPRSRSARRRETEPLASPRARSSNECCAVESSREENCPVPFSSTDIGLFLFL